MTEYVKENLSNSNTDKDILTDTVHGLEDKETVKKCGDESLTKKQSRIHYKCAKSIFLQRQVIPLIVFTI